MATFDLATLFDVIRDSLLERRDTIQFSHGVRLWFYPEADQFIVDNDGEHERFSSVESAIGRVWDLTCAPTDDEG